MSNSCPKQLVALTGEQTVFSTSVLKLAGAGSGKAIIIDCKDGLLRAENNNVELAEIILRGIIAAPTSDAAPLTAHT